MLRSGPAVAAHFAHRPRQACRRRPGRTVSPLRLEQLTLFDVEPLTPVVDPIPAFIWAPAAVSAPPAARRRAAPSKRRRRRAWLPRLVRWIKARAAG